MPTTTRETNTPQRTAAEDKLWAALHARPNATTLDLAQTAGIGKSTAGKILTNWAGDGSVTRITGIGQGGRRVGRWTITSSDTGDDGATADSEPVDAGDAEGAQALEAEQPTDTDSHDATAEVDLNETGPAADTASASGDATRSTSRLAPGALRGMVEDFLTERPDLEFTAGDIGRKLNRSPGAIANALVTLTEKGVATLVCDRPKKYRAATTEN